MNIYLRLPTYVAQFWRNRFEPAIAPHEPIILSQYDRIYRAISEGLSMNVPIQEGHVPACFSHIDWRSITHGNSPLTRKPVIQRHADTYPDYDEVSQCCGMKQNERSGNYDFLCIQMPKFVYDIEGEKHDTNASYSLRITATGDVIRLFMAEFRKALADCEVMNQMYCLFGKVDDSKAIDRKRLDLLTRFLEHYDIYCGKDETELRAIRKELQRVLGDVVPTGHKLREILPYNITYTDSAERVIKMQ